MSATGLVEIRQEQGIEMVEMQAALDAALLDETMHVTAPGQRVGGSDRGADPETDSARGAPDGHQLSSPDCLRPKRTARSRVLAAFLISPPHHGK